MRLLAWIEATGRNFTTFGQLIGIRRPDTVRRYCLEEAHPDHRIPRPSIMRRIYRATVGEVAPNDFYDLPDLTDPGAGQDGQATEADGRGSAVPSQAADPRPAAPSSNGLDHGGGQ